MIERTDSIVKLGHPDGSWQATHDLSRFGGPHELHVAGTCVLESAHFHIDDFVDDSAVVTKARAFRKGGAGMVTSSAYLPFGGEPAFSQTCRYAANHARITFDLQWRAGSAVKRHLGLGGVFLPGAWKRVFCVPPVTHLAAGVQPGWHDLPNAPGAPDMLGHWHRPPLALVFEREDGLLLEVGTGTDVWRWEHCLGCGPEQASYKVMRQADGLRLVREPLMCCESFAPKARAYRFTWHLAWAAARRGRRHSAGARMLSIDAERGVSASDLEDIQTSKKDAAVALDFAGIQWPAAAQRAPTQLGFVRDELDAAPCWQAPVPQRLARHVIRQLSATSAVRTLVVHGMEPGVCWCPAHLGRTRRDGLAHWDINAILDLAVWVRRQLGDECEIRADTGAWGVLPSLAGLFGRNGFDAD